MRVEFDSIERPLLEIEVPDEFASEDGSEKSPSAAAHIATSSPTFKGLDSPKSSPRTADELLDPESETAKLEMEFGKVGRDYSSHEIGGWEFDELEQDLSPRASGSTK